MSFFNNMFKNKPKPQPETTTTQNPPTQYPSQQQQSFQQQQQAFTNPMYQQQPELQQVQQQQEKPKGKMFKGLNVKKTTQSNEFQLEQKTEAYDIQHEKPSSDILNDEFKQQQLHQQIEGSIETPTPYEEPQEQMQQLQQEPPKVDFSAVRKKPTGFNFLKKKTNSDENKQQPESAIIERQERQEELVSTQAQSNYQWNEQEVQDSEKLERAKQISPDLPEIQQTQQQVVSYEAVQSPSPKRDVLPPKDIFSPDRDEKRAQESQTLFNKFKNKSQRPSHQDIEMTEHLQKAKYSMIIDEIQNFERDNYNRIANLILQQQKLESDRDYLKIRQEKISQQISHYTTEQQICIEQEQFDRADEIQKLIEQLTGESEKAEENISILNQSLIQIEKDKEKALNQETPFYEKIIERINEVEQAHIKYVEEYKQEQTQNLKRLRTHIEEENERVKISHVHIEIDCKHLDEEESHINQIMGNQTREYREEQKQMMGKKTELEYEIQDLLEQLKKKEQELSMVNENLEELQEKITNVQHKFNNQLSKVAQKKQKFNEEMEQLQKERDHIAELDQDHERKSNKFNERLNNLDKQQQEMERQRSQLLQRSKDIFDKLINEKDVISKFKAVSQQTIESHQNLQKVERQIDDINFRKSLNQQQLNELLQSKSELTAKIPVMMEDKQKLIQIKQFKGAQSVTTLIKETQQQIDKYDAKIQEIYQIDTDLIKTAQTLDQERDQLKNEYEKNRAISEIQRYYVLEFRIDEMKSLVQLLQDQSAILELQKQIYKCENEKNNLYETYHQEIDKENNQLNQQNTNEQLEKEQSPSNILEDQENQNQSPEQIQNFQQPQTPEIITENEFNGQQNQEETQQSPQIQQQAMIEQNKMTTEQKFEKVKQVVHEYRTLEQTIQKLENEMNEMAANDRFEEADELNQQVEGLQSHLNQLVQNQLKDLELQTIEDAENWLQQNS